MVGLTAGTRCGRASWPQRSDKTLTIHRHLIVIMLLLWLTGCATPASQQWSGVPEETMPTALAPWQIVWDDDRREWHQAESGQAVGHGQVPIEAWSFESNAIAMRLHASDQLNLFRGRTHTLLLHVYQVRDPGGISRRLDTPAEVLRLLRRGDDDLDVLALKQVIIGPNQQKLLRIDRADRARYLVLIAAYAELDIDDAVRIVPIPEVNDKPRGRQRFQGGNLGTTLNPFSSTPPPRPGRLTIWLELGDTRLERLQMLVQ